MTLRLPNTSEVGVLLVNSGRQEGSHRTRCEDGVLVNGMNPKTADADGMVRRGGGCRAQARFSSWPIKLVRHWPAFSPLTGSSVRVVTVCSLTSRHQQAAYSEYFARPWTVNWTIHDSRSLSGGYFVNAFADADIQANASMLPAQELGWPRPSLMLTSSLKAETLMLMARSEQNITIEHGRGEPRTGCGVYFSLTASGQITSFMAGGFDGYKRRTGGLQNQ